MAFNWRGWSRWALARWRPMPNGSDRPEEAGEPCGGYRLTRRIAEGRGAEVFLAVATRRGTEAVVKRLPHHRATPQRIARLDRESWLLQHLRHPALPRWLDTGRAADGSPFLAMERIDGITLHELISRRGAIGDGRVVDILRQLTDALAAIHDAGWIHRDVAPKNVMLQRRPSDGDGVRLFDLGIAIPIAPSQRDGVDAERISGSPSFMSPEACQSADGITPLSDVYSLGCLAYYLLTGAVVHAGATAIEICWRQIHADPTPVEQVANAPICDQLARVVALCLSKSPDERPPSMRALRDRLDTCKPRSPWGGAEADAWWSDWNRDA